MSLHHIPKAAAAILTAASLVVSASAQTKGYKPERPPTVEDIERISAGEFPQNGPSGPIFGLPTVRTYPFSSKGKDLDDGVYWQVTGHSSGHKRDMSGTKFDAGSGSWTKNHPASSGLSGDARRLIWNTPIYSPAKGIVLTCWRNAPDGDDPGEAGCVDDPAPGTLCRTPGGGNHLRIWVPEERRMFLIAHFREATVPPHLCPHNDVWVADANDKSGPYNYNPDIVVPFPFIEVEEGELIGRVGNSGRSGGPHLHIELLDCPSPLDRTTCKTVAARFNKARTATKFADRDVMDNEWEPLNGATTVKSPLQLVLPDEGVGGLIPNPPQASISLEQVNEGFAQISLNVTNPAAPVSNFVWEKVEPPSAQLADQATLRWNVSAGCGSGVQSITLNSPGGSQTQTFPDGTSTVDGQLETQSFALEELEDICLDWAESVSGSAFCNQAPEQCANQETFHLLGDGIGTGNSDVSVNLQCKNGLTSQVLGVPALTLRCGAIPFGFLQ